MENALNLINKSFLYNSKIYGSDNIIGHNYDQNYTEIIHQKLKELKVPIHIDELGR